MTDTDKLLAEKDGAIGRLTFNNPARRNACSYAMWDGIAPILDDFEADPDIRVIVLRGAGDKAFCAGADISEFETERSTPEQVEIYDGAGDRASARILSVSKPTVAIIRGFCVGGGMGLALECDLRISSDTGRFGVPAAKLGIGYGHEGVARLVDVVGPSFAKEIFYTARLFSAEEALAMGLINRLVPDGELEDYLLDYCATMAANAPLSLSCIKTTVSELTRIDGEPDFALCERLVTECFSSDDYVEGRRAFMEKRRPAFRGR
ncbi:MAG: enoyl-CoA hydratase [Pseudomonadota bacterium]|nr:enoyl-CoA hydratase [Pseudomonadota bacterium]